MCTPVNFWINVPSLDKPIKTDRRKETEQNWKQDYVVFQQKKPEEFFNWNKQIHVYNWTGPAVDVFGYLTLFAEWY